MRTILGRYECVRVCGFVRLCDRLKFHLRAYFYEFQRCMCMSVCVQKMHTIHITHWNISTCAPRHIIVFLYHVLAQSILEPIASYSQWHAKTSSLFLRRETQASPKITIIISGASKPGEGSQCDSSLNLQSFKCPAWSVFTRFKMMCHFM